MTIKTLLKSLTITAAIMLPYQSISALDHPGITNSSPNDSNFPLVVDNSPTPILYDPNDLPGISIAVNNLSIDFGKVCGTNNSLLTNINTNAPSKLIVAASMETSIIKDLFKKKKLNEGDLKGKYEKYVMTTVDNPYPGVEEALVIAGSDRRGTIYGIYELSEQIGVSPWYDWADVAPAKHDNLYIADGTYTAGEPAVKYRGIFLNDEGPCLMQWVKNTYGTD